MDERTARKAIDALIERYKTEEGSHAVVNILYPFKNVRHMPELSTGFRITVSCLICSQPKECDWVEPFAFSEVVDYLLAHNKCSQKN